MSEDWPARERRRLPEHCQTEVLAELTAIKVELARLQETATRNHEQRIIMHEENRESARKMDLINEKTQRVLYGNGELGLVRLADRNSQAIRLLIWLVATTTVMVLGMLFKQIGAVIFGSA